LPSALEDEEDDEVDDEADGIDEADADEVGVESRPESWLAPRRSNLAKLPVRRCRRERARLVAGDGDGDGDGEALVLDDETDDETEADATAVGGARINGIAAAAAAGDDDEEEAERPEVGAERLDGAEGDGERSSRSATRNGAGADWSSAMVEEEVVIERERGRSLEYAGRLSMGVSVGSRSREGACPRER